MRNMSFSLTTQQMRDGSKTVTRRMNWQSLKPGEYLCAVEKGMGLKRGETINRLGVIRVNSLRRESLRTLIEHGHYGRSEILREGFSLDSYTPETWVAMFCKANSCSPDTIVTRIEFEHVPFNELDADMVEQLKRGAA